MPARAADPPLDYERLASFLSALAYPVRLELLHKLQFPHTVGEIEVTPHREDRGRRQDRPLARQTVQGHLDKLMAAGLVRAEPVEQSGKQIPAYQVDPSRLYALIEEIRRLSVMYAGKGATAPGTGTVKADREPVQAEGPHLLLVHGVYEGKVFPLDSSTRGEDGWVIGRDPDLTFSLDYDPFVSERNAKITREDGRFVVHDLEASKNGTYVNWHQLPEGGSWELTSGEVIGVGRSLLSFVDG